MGNHNYDAAKFAFDLRIQIWEELFGFEKNEIVDPINENLWQKIIERSKVIHLFFRKI